MSHLKTWSVPYSRYNVTDSIHIFTFESPTALWDENWKKYGTPIIGKLNVLPNIPPN
jgi:hypothetical protein